MIPQAVYVLFGALFTVAVAAALGKLLLRRSGVTLYREEEHALAFLCGAPLLSLLVFAACVAGVARKGVFLWIGIAVLALAFGTGAHRPRGAALPPLGRFWKGLFAIVYGAYAVLYFVNAMAPEYSPDGSTYHLGLVYRYLMHHGFYRITTNMYANLSQGVEMLYLFAFSFGKHSAAALVHAAFLLSLPWLMLCYARRAGMAAAGVAGALFVFASPVVGIDGSSAYNDVAVAAVALTVFYLLQVWDGDRESGLLVPIGLLAGFAYAVKYTAFVAVPYALLFIVWKCRRKRQPWLRPALVVGLAAAVLILPWALKNWIWLGNPFSPFANTWFPNPYVWVGFEREYKAYFRMYDLASYRDLPLVVAVRGQLGGVVGPLFLLAPVALLALRKRVGRQLLLGAAVFGATYFGNIGARFLIPVLPFLSLAMALEFAQVRYLAPALVAAHAVLSFPAVMPRYCDRYAWRLSDFPWRAALRIVPEERFLEEKLHNYGITRTVERVVPPGAGVLATTGVSEAYTARDVLVAYQSATGKVLGNILWTPLIQEWNPSWLLRFHFAPRPLRKVRVVQTAHGEPDYWSVSELRVFGGDRELPRDPRWRLRAQPNPWGVRMAFDNSLVTRWSSAQTLYPGMFLEVDFVQPETIDTVAIDATHDQYKIRLRLEGEDAAGRRVPLAAAPEQLEGAPAANLRRAATDELKFRGIDFLVIYDSDFGADDYRTRPDAWGIQLAGEAPGARLYRIL